MGSKIMGYIFSNTKWVHLEALGINIK
jgi:hypothetical protein